MKWKNETRKVKDLVPANYNPRQLTEKQAKDLRKSLERFDLVAPIIINTDNKIIGGHQRIKILSDLGISTVDVRVPEKKLTEKQERELNLRLNKNLGEWDFDKLFEFDTDLLSDVGFEKDEINKLLDSHTEAEEDNFDIQAELDKKMPPVAIRGQIWLLGEHRLMCGDSTKREDVEKLMDGKKADMVFTDPPYGVSYAAKNEYLNTIAPGNRIQTPIENDHMDLSDTSEFIYLLFCQIKNILAERSSYYITAPQGGELLMMMMMMQKAEIPLRHCLIWVKNNHVLGRTDYNYKHEPILYGWVGVHDFYGNGEHKFSTWEINKPNKNDLHPTMKPVALIVNAIKNSTKNNQVVVDFCGGSGSTLIACEQTNRKCYMMEIDEKYCDVIIKRYIDFTGKKAKLLV